MVLPGCSDAYSPDPTIAIVRQPSQAVVGQALVPAIEVLAGDGDGNPASGAVTITIEPNPCNWPLGGTTTAQLINGQATFADVTFGQVADGYVLEVQWGSSQASSGPIDVAPGMQQGSLVHENTLCSKPNPQEDAESLTYSVVDSSFWLADDDKSSVFRVSRSGQYLSQFTADSVAVFLPEALECDDGDGDPTTSCSYLGELEHVTYDPVNQLLYVLNTVNDEDVDPVEDRPAIFMFQQEECAGCLVPVSWQPMAHSPNVGGLIAIDGELYLAFGRRLYRYDYARNTVLDVDEDGNPLPPSFTSSSTIRAMGYDGAYLWLLLNSGRVATIDWAARAEVARYDLTPFGIEVPKGVERVGDYLYVLEGNQPNPIYVFRLPAP